MYSISFHSLFTLSVLWYLAFLKLFELKGYDFFGLHGNTDNIFEHWQFSLLSMLAQQNVQSSQINWKYSLLKQVFLNEDYFFFYPPKIALY